MCVIFLRNTFVILLPMTRLYAIVCCMKNISINDKSVTMHIGDKAMSPIMGIIANSSDDNIQLWADDSGSLACKVQDGCYIHATNDQFIADVLAGLNGEIELCAVPDNVVRYLQEHYTLQWSTSCYMYVYNGQPYDSSVLDGLDIRPLQPEHWQLVSEGTPYKPPEQRVVDDIVNRISSAIYVDNQPVSWCVLHKDNSLGMLYTLPSYRGKGYGVKMVISQCIKLLEMGQLPYSCVIKGNDVAQRITSQYNVQYICDVTWCGIYKGE